MPPTEVNGSSALTALSPRES